jgi:hypothetical protein
MEGSHDLQGGAINRGLLFTGLPLPPLGSQDGQYKQNLIGVGPSDQVHGGMGWAISFCYGDHLLETHRICRALHLFKDCRKPQHRAFLSR